MPIIVGTLSKDPDETRYYKMDWSAHIGTDQIVLSRWDVPEGLTLVANGVVVGNTKTYVLLSNGAAGGSYVVTNTVTLGNEEVWQRSGRLDIRQY